jgi:pyruvate dehydrogenase (quinone)
MSRSTLADQLIDVLREAGVERVYGVVGDSLNPFVDAVRRSGAIEWVHVRHEEAGAFAATAEAQLTGRLAVCAGSVGPGNTHLVNGVYDAHRTRAPLLVIASHVPSLQVGTGFFQETHPERLFLDCSDYLEIVSQAEQMPRVPRIAVQHALARPGVSTLVISGDVLHRDISQQTGRSAVVPSRAIATPRTEDVEALAERLNEAETVTLFCGAGTEGAHDEVMELAARVHSPIGHTLRGKEWIQYDNPFDVGMSGLLGYGACYEASHEADLLVMLGTDFPYNDFLPGSHTVQVDHDPAHLGRRTLIELGVHGDVGATLRAVLPLVDQKTERSFLDEMLERHARSLEHVVAAYTHDIDHRLPIHPEYAARSSTSSPPRTRSSRLTPGCATSGRLATSRPTAAAG